MKYFLILLTAILISSCTGLNNSEFEEKYSGFEQIKPQSCNVIVSSLGNEKVEEACSEFKEGDYFVVSLEENQSCFSVSFVYTFENEVSFKYLGFKNIPITNKYFRVQTAEIVYDDFEFIRDFVEFNDVTTPQYLEIEQEGSLLKFYFAKLYEPENFAISENYLNCSFEEIVFYGLQN